MKLEKRSTKSLKDFAWILCSQYIRQRDKGRCFTCGKIDEWKQMQAGHFIHGHTKSTFFEEKNIHCQCARCNTYLSGNQIEYTLRMIRDYGKEFVDKLIKKSKQGYIPNRKEYIKWILFYKEKLKILEKS